jgi:hypothetical protein
MKSLAVVGVAAAALGAGCLHTNAPKGFTVQYAIGIYGCAVSCQTPGSQLIASAVRGDTVWVQHVVSLITALEPTALGRVLPECESHTTVENGRGLVFVALPTSTCPDSVESHDFVADSVVTRLDQWVIDSSLADTGNTAYAIVGHVLQKPLLEPRFLFTINQ